ncbi:MFS transporter [Echinicola strongylocentroti]|uniref:MFS transporter n=1 Tax=Echinicola strongylocentroti TaxID=1795355 RepID=A0A2Z4IP36_9BACT|nr:peptide MFS transporter [Echinicola strongylocentroti]AWW32519.1 MFS transporter [Echinicola strongylocentroti]
MLQNEETKNHEIDRGFDGPSMFGHPRGLMTLFFTEMWERFSYYGMRALLILFMTTAVIDGGLGFDDKTSGAIYGLYTMGVYLLALPGGWLADRLLGLKKSVWYGGIIIALGHFTMGLPGILSLLDGGHEATSALSSLDTTSFFLGLILIVVGTGLLKPNISSIVGQLYHDGSSKRDAGFSIFYMGINIGGFIAPIICSTFAEIDWHLGFGAAGFGMILGLIQYRLTSGTLRGKGDLAEPQSEEEIAHRRRLRLFTFLTVVVVAVVLFLMFQGVIVINAAMIADASYKVIGVVAAAFFIYILLFGGLTRDEKKKVGVIAILLCFGALFWSGFEQAGSTLNLFAERFTDRQVMGWEIPSGYFQSANSLFIVIFAPIFAALWVWLAKRHLEPSSPIKFAFGLLLLGVGFLVMYFAAKVAASGDMAAPSWLLFTYLFHTFGELSLSPVGLSLTTKLAPKKFQGQMMGMWFLSVALGNLVAGIIAGEASGETKEAVAEMPDQYMLIVMVSVGAGLLLLLITKPIRKLMGNVR